LNPFLECFYLIIGNRFFIKMEVTHPAIKQIAYHPKNIPVGIFNMMMVQFPFSP